MTPSLVSKRQTVWPQGLFARAVQQRLPPFAQVALGISDGLLVFDFEFDAYLRQRLFPWPLGRSEAGFGGLRQWPQPEMLATSNFFR